MNFYFVFEGKTEPIVYKKWLSVLLPDLTEVDSFDAVNQNNYYYVSDMGVPSCYRVAANAIQDINGFPKYNYLVLFTDADRFTVAEKKAEADEQIKLELQYQPFKTLPENCQLEIIVQKVCIETWFLGNRNFFVRHPQNNPTLTQYIEYFDVSKSNPEDLASEFVQDEENTKDIFGYKTKALFHEGYLREIFKERSSASNKSFSYRKSKPMEVQEEYYLKQLIARIEANSDQLLSFQEFIEFCLKIKGQPNK
jgi:DNA polymerase I-like protein with 3'-5' exonuclease and polymerase domains